MDLREYPDTEILMMSVADTIAGDLESSLNFDGRASLAVPGGTTPGPVFDALSATKHVDWANVSVMLTDERWVPETSDRSNTRLLRERLLVDHAAAATYVPLYADAETPEEKLPSLEAAIKPILPLSVCLLGMGADMHTASIFPGADRLKDALNGDGILYPMRAPGAPEPRITLSATVLREAVNIHVLITGHEKREALERAQTLDPMDAPIASILSQATVHWAE